jgi:hypothetical protein
LGDTNDDDDDDDDESFNDGQAFKFNPHGGRDGPQASPSSAPVLSTAGSPSSALRKGKTKDMPLFEPLVRPLHF